MNSKELLDVMHNEEIDFDERFEALKEFIKLING